MSDEGERRYTKAELLERMAGTRRAVDAAIAGKSEAVMTRPGADGWSAKDHLAHLSAWQRSLIALLEGESRPAALGIEDLTQEEESGFAEINAVLHERTKDQPLDRVLAEFRQSRRDLLAVLDRLSDDDLYEPYSHYQPNDPPYNPDPVIGWIVGNTFGHEEEHLEWFEGLLRG
ncbi:MAG TPA: DinB family protein [Thermomicrobiales bacterium]